MLIATNPLDDARRAALTLLSRVFLWCWSPTFALAVLLNWERMQEQPLLLMIYPLVPFIGWYLRPSPSRNMVRRTRYGILIMLVATSAGILVNGIRAPGVTAAAVLLTLTGLFEGRRAMMILVLFLIGASAVGTVFVAAGMTVPTSTEQDLPVMYRVITSIITFSGLWFTAATLAATLRIYREASDALEARQQALFDAQRESELLQRRELVGTMATGMTHDLANIVQVMTTSADLLDDRTLDDESRRAVRDIRAVGGQASDVLRTLLSIGKPMPATIEAVDMSALLARLELLLRPLMGPRIVVLVEQRATRAMLADRGRLEQAVVNLALNARDAMPQGGTLQVRTSDADAVTPNGPRGVQLEVLDTGTGITPEVQARMFEPYYSTKVRNAGSGLGLPLVARIVSESGGHMTVQSTPGAGTTFTLWVPAASNG